MLANKKDATAVPLSGNLYIKLNIKLNVKNVSKHHVVVA
jgi:hypothetical protein